MAELPLFFTRHALNRMRWRKIARSEIERIGLAPASRIPDREHPRIHLFGTLPDRRRVRVVVVEEKRRVVIVTVIDKER